MTNLSAPTPDLTIPETPAVYTDADSAHTALWKDRLALMTPEDLRNPFEPHSRRGRSWRAGIANKLERGGWDTVADVPNSDAASVLARPVISAHQWSLDQQYIDTFLECYGTFSADELAAESEEDHLALDTRNVLDVLDVREDLDRMALLLRHGGGGRLNDLPRHTINAMLP